MIHLSQTLLPCVLSNPPSRLLMPRIDLVLTLILARLISTAFEERQVEVPCNGEGVDEEVSVLLSRLRTLNSGLTNYVACSDMPCKIIIQYRHIWANISVFSTIYVQLFRRCGEGINEKVKSLVQLSTIDQMCI